MESGREQVFRSFGHNELITAESVLAAALRYQWSSISAIPIGSASIKHCGSNVDTFDKGKDGSVVLPVACIDFDIDRPLTSYVFSFHPLLIEIPCMKSVWLDQASHFRSVFMDKVVPILANQSKATYIAAAISIFVATKLYSIFAYPRNLRHIQNAPLLAFLASIIGKTAYVDHVNRFIVPHWKESNGFMVIYDHLGWTIHVTNPEAVKTIVYKTDIFPKNENNDMIPVGSLMRKFFGTTNMALANGHEWMKRRKVMWHSKPLLQRFTLDAIGLVGFGSDFNAMDTPDGEWVKTYNDLAANISDFLFLFFPTFDLTFLRFFPARQTQHKNLEKLDKLFNSVVENKRQALSQANSEVEESEKDLLTLMIEAGQNEKDDVEPLASSELRDEIVLFFLAGHDTTSNTLTCALYQLAANPDIQDKARKEVLDILGDDHSDVKPTVDQIKNLNYLSKVMKEASNSKFKRALPLSAGQ
ncbi:hypothetical protein INT43_007642 [Umbelopsis isabellina]|uniref:Cytochrome P450 n=1 Tax=Mortierella isabellina TaxID=91625 RepID=A0A8H7PN06_MORIS|nr:hypothetical protein INT43_007642 [Umbelopsis isabellina]